MATVSELVTRFGFEIDDHALKELSEGIELVKEGIIGLGEALIGEAVGLYELVHHAAEAGVHLKIMSAETGIAADKLQELQFRAKLADVSTDELNQSMNLLARNMIQAKQGSEEARKHFRQLGISTAELRSGTLTTDKALDRIATTFEKLPDGPQKTALAMEVFGRGGAKMVQVLNTLHNEISPVNRKILEMSMITDAQIEASEEFHIQMETLKTGFAGVARIIGFGLIPAATEAIELMKKWLVENYDIIKADLTEFVLGMVAAFKLTLRIVNALVQAFSGLAHGIGGVKIMTELLLGAFAVLMGASILIGIGKVTEAVVALASSFRVASLEAVGLQLAIGAAFVVLLLVMEDIYSFFQGKDSFLGDILNVLPEIGKLFKSTFEPIFEPIVKLITMMTEGFGSWGEIFKTLGVLIVNFLLLPLRAVVASVGAIASIIGRLSGSAGVKAFAAGTSDFADNYLKLNANGPSGVTPQDAVGAGADASKQVNNKVAVEQTFVFPPGTDPALVGDKIGTKATDGFEDVLRLTQRSTSNGGAY